MNRQTLKREAAQKLRRTVATRLLLLAQQPCNVGLTMQRWTGVGVFEEIAKLADRVFVEGSQAFEPAGVLAPNPGHVLLSLDMLRDP